LGSFIGVIDAGHPGKSPSPSLAVQAFGVSFFADFERCVDIHFEKRYAHFLV